MTGIDDLSYDLGHAVRALDDIAGSLARLVERVAPERPPRDDTAFQTALEGLMGLIGKDVGIFGVSMILRGRLTVESCGDCGGPLDIENDAYFRLDRDGERVGLLTLHRQNIAHAGVHRCGCVHLSTPGGPIEVAAEDCERSHFFDDEEDDE